MADRFHQPALNERNLFREHRQHRFGHVADELVKPDERIGGGSMDSAEPTHQRLARDPVQIADALEAETAEHKQRCIVEPQRGNGQAAKPRGHVVISVQDSPVLPVMHQRPSRTGSRRNGKLHGKLAPFQQRARIGEQRRPHRRTGGQRR